MKFLPIILFTFFMAINAVAVALSVDLPVDEWAKKLADPGDKKTKLTST